MTKFEMQERTKAFSLRVVRLFQALPRTGVAPVLGKQLLRCGTSVGANYRAACLGKSRADFLAKIKICEEEADESVYWLELLIDSGEVRAEKLSALLREAREISAMMSSSAKTVREAGNF